jgi:hypothetical protein
MSRELWTEGARSVIETDPRWCKTERRAGRRKGNPRERERERERERGSNWERGVDCRGESVPL